MEDERLREAVRRLQRNCSVPQLAAVDVDDVIRLKNTLRGICENSFGLHGSLVYSPRDLSVYVRTELTNGDTVDVSLCTQDVTHSSDIPLNGDLSKCDLRVGERNAIDNLPRVESLSPIVNHFVKNRVVHRIIRFPRNGPGPYVYTVELARTFQPERETTPINVDAYANELWGRGDFHDRVQFSDVNFSGGSAIFSSWLVCMTIFENEPEAQTIESCRAILLESAENLTQRIMIRDVNYESMFRSRCAEHQRGRFSWPIVLAFCTSMSLKQEGLTKLYPRDEALAMTLGTYRGRYTTRHGLSMAVTILGFLAVILIPVLGATVGDWDVKVLAIIIPASLTIYALVIVASNAILLEKPLPWVQFVRSNEAIPIVGSLETAVKLLLSDACRLNYNGENLCFTGEQYSGNLMFPWPFTYEQLASVGFFRLSDAQGREHLRVPRNGNLVKMTRSEDGQDHFQLVAVEAPAHLLFEKRWRSTCVPSGLN